MLRAQELSPAGAFPGSLVLVTRGIQQVKASFHLPAQVVAIVMDTFTDVDLLREVLDAAARRVPVYILLDEMHAQLFLDMAAKCRVDLNYVEVSAAAAGAATMHGSRVEGARQGRGRRGTSQRVPSSFRVPLR